MTDKIISVLSDDWEEVILRFQVEDYRCREVLTFCYHKDNNLYEESMPDVDGLEDLIFELREQVSGKEPERFSYCCIIIKSNGDFSVDYSYEPIDWGSNMTWHYINAQHPA